MVKPIIILVDDEPQVLNAIERDLRQHFKGKYRLIKSISGKEALNVVQKLKQRNSPIALFLVDQRMPEMSGTEFLEKAMKFEPDAGKVLLTAYADTKAAIDSINVVGLDHYLTKPWEPETLFPPLDDLLDDWNANYIPPYEGIRVAGTLWSANSHSVKDFLARNQIPYKWLDIEKEPEAKELVRSVTSDTIRLPVVFFPDNSFLIEPDKSSLAEKIGLQTKATYPFYDLIVIGAGPAGLAAGVYGASEGLRTIIIEKEATGGQAGTSSRIENYLGFPKGLSGSDLARRATDQAKRLGAEILLPQEVINIRVRLPYKIITLADGSELSCYALIIATGVSVRRLEVKGINAFTGAGVYYGAAMTEAKHYRDQTVLIVGGANSAGQGAMYYSKFASRVIMLIRGDSLTKSMSQYLIDQIHSTKNIEIQNHKEVVEVKGKERLESVIIRNLRTSDLQEFSTAALIIFIGASPANQMVNEMLDCNADGFILTGQDLIKKGKKPKEWKEERDPTMFETSIPGVFAAGDVRNGSSKRVAAAVGEGAVVVHFVHEYLKTV